MGVDGLFSTLLTVFQAFALVWIGLIIVATGVLVRAVVRSRDSEWIRSQDEIDRLEERVSASIEKRPEQAA